MATQAVYDNSKTTLPTFDTTAVVSVTPVVDAFSGAIRATGSDVQTAITAAANNPNDPTNLIKMQAAMANYNIALTVTSAVVKSIEETAKGITQKL